MSDYLSLEEGVNLAVSCLEEASKDICTGGLDIAIINSDNIQEYGEYIKLMMSVAKRSIIREIVEKETKH